MINTILPRGTRRSLPKQARMQKPISPMRNVLDMPKERTLSGEISFALQLIPPCAVEHSSSSLSPCVNDLNAAFRHLTVLVFLKVEQRNVRTFMGIKHVDCATDAGITSHDDSDYTIELSAAFIIRRHKLGL